MRDSPMENLPYQQLSQLIKADANKEHECRECLQYAKELLVNAPVINYVYLETERRSHAGNSDYIVSAKILDEGGLEPVRVYVWELKAPQCYLFEEDTRNRLRPSKDLINAENQLFYYLDDLKGNDQARHEFGITHPHNVCFGGIIIGCRRRWVRGNFDENKRNKLYERALMIRREYMYDRLGMRLMTWDYILDHFKQQQ